MKKLNLTYLIVFLFSFALLSACDDDSDGSGSSFVGNYVISEAILASDLTLNTVEQIPLTLKAGEDITVLIQTALLGAIECTPDKSLIELRDDKSMYLSCQGTDSELDAGTWIEVNETTITLNMNPAAVPGSDIGFALTVSDITISGNVLTGTTTVPLPYDMLSGLVEDASMGQLHLDPNTMVELVQFTIKLTKQ